MIGKRFYFDVDEAKRSVAAGRAFNVLHLGSATKIDVFPMGTDRFHESELSRSTAEEWVVPGGGSITLPVASAEDTILSKLRWYKPGGQVSDRQWGDILGIATRAGVDWAYLNTWAPQLGISDLLKRLHSEIL